MKSRCKDSELRSLYDELGVEGLKKIRDDFNIPTIENSVTGLTDSIEKYRSLKYDQGRFTVEVSKQLNKHLEDLKEKKRMSELTVNRKKQIDIKIKEEEQEYELLKRSKHAITDIKIFYSERPQLRQTLLEFTKQNRKEDATKSKWSDLDLVKLAEEMLNPS